MMSATDSPNPPPAERLWVRLLRGVGLFVSLLLLAVGGWAGANLLLRDPTPQYLWTESDLPPLPPDADNGWVTFADESTRLGRVSADTGTLSSSLRVSAHPTPQEAWREVRRRDGDIRSVTKDAVNRPWIELLGRSYAKPAFADACPIDPEVDCRWMGLFGAHQLAELAMLNHSLDDRWNEAIAGAARLARGDFAFASSTRGLLSQMVGLAIATRTLELLELLLAGYEEQAKTGERSAVLPSTWSDLTSAIGSVKRSDLGMQRSVTAEYLFLVRALEIAEQEPAKAGVKNWGPASALFFDRGECVALMNQDFKPLMEYANTPSAGPPRIRSVFAQGSFWWLHNPIGKVVLDGARGHMLPQIEKGSKQADELIVKRDGLLKTIASTRSVTP